MKKLSILLAVIFGVTLMSCNNTGDTAKTTEPATTVADKEEKKEEKPKKKSPAETATLKTGGAKLSINYSSPRVKGRTIWGDLVKYDEVWRTGADEATVFETNKALVIEGKQLPTGKYSFFTIPGQEEWTVIFNTVHKQWGAYKYDETKDVFRVTVKPHAVEEAMENMTFYLQETTEGEGEIKLAWEKVKIAVGFKVAQ